MSLSGSLHSLTQAAANFVYPPACLHCFQSLKLKTGDATATPHFCGDCQANLAPDIPFCCERCSAPVGPYLDTTLGCQHCRIQSFSFERAISIGPYEGELRKACLRCKQPGQSPLTAALTRILADRDRPALESWYVDMVIPIPHHWFDRLLQTHHPSETIATSLGRFLKVPVERHILRKKKRTPKQIDLNLSARRQNLASAFEIAGRARLDGLKILLTDDTMTTGTTVHRAARVLQKAGAGSIRVAVLARALKT